MAARWRKQPRPKGLAGRGALLGYELRENEVTLLRVIAVREVGRLVATGWYWAGLGQNSCAKVAKTPEEAKTQADIWYKENKHLHTPIKP